MVQLQDDFTRSQFQATRVEERNEISGRLDEAKSNEAYFLDVIEYYNSKITFYEAIESSLNPDDKDK